MLTVASTLHLQLFATFQARLHDQPLPRLRSVKGRMLLAYLALKRGREVNHAEVARALWPDSELATDNLSQTLLDLRRALGGKGNPYLLAHTRHTLCLNLDEANVDLIAFERACKREDMISLEQAIGLYGGSLLEGWEETWIYAERQECRSRYVQTLERLREAAMVRGNWVSARTCLRRLAAVEELEEEAWLTLLRALIAQHDYMTASQVYEELSLCLRPCNRTPSPETRQLLQQIPLKERTQPSRRPRSSQKHSHLPYPLTDLIGRDQEIREIERRLDARLVTLTGSGGVGKTRLAIHVAHRVADEYADGAFVIDLAALSDSSLVVPWVAAGLEVRAEVGQPLLEALLSHLRSRHLLLVLDNCEHLLMACSSLAHELLLHCPNLHILVTSRQALNVAGEVVWRVASLSAPDLNQVQSGDEEALAAMQRCEAVQLFVQRSGQHQQRFQLTRSNAQAVATICVRLDGIPLALELAAARMEVLSAEQIASRLDDRFRLLRGPSHLLLPRHQTLGATLDWSYDLLSADEQWLLRELSVFVGRWTLEAAEAVCKNEIHPWDMLELLTSLVDKSLVIAEARENEMRYRMLETVRQYAAEKLQASGEAEAMKARHRDWSAGHGDDIRPQSDRIGHKISC